MRAALVKFGDVVLEYASSSGQSAPEFEGGNRYVRDFLRVTGEADVMLLSLGEVDAELTDGRVVAEALRLAPVRWPIVGRLRLMAGLLRIRERLLRFRPEVVVCLDTGPPAAVCERVCRQIGAQLIVVVTTDISGTGRGRWLRARNAASALGSPQTRAVLVCTASLMGQVIPLTRLGVAVQVYHPDYRSAAARGSTVTSAAERARELVFVGRLASVKGSDHLCAIAAGVRRGDGRFVVIGDGPDKSAILDQIASEGIQDVVEFTGTLPHSQVLSRIAHARALVVPSRSEGVAKVVIEALLMGTPVIAYAVGGIPDVVDDGLNGRLVPAGDVAGLSNMAEHVLRDEAAWRVLLEGASASGAALANRHPTFGEALLSVMGVER